ncbi:hypothetical protein VE02_10052 [Pseudogymnoascus sp. 03VT05]|nr:hypothetical protein VE02_10052 [Pseudogymnoascus sp. 03VT05]
MAVNAVRFCERRSLTPTQRETQDGVIRAVYLINDQQPGPLIETDEGDELEAHSHRSVLTCWNRLLQRGTPQMDGVPGVTQVSSRLPDCVLTGDNNDMQVLYLVLGQRYSAMIKLDQSPGNYFLRFATYPAGDMEQVLKDQAIISYSKEEIQTHREELKKAGGGRLDLRHLLDTPDRAGAASR